MARQKKYELPYGEGSFYHREKDDRWVGVIEAGTSIKGTRRRITVTDKDKDRAWDKLVAKRKDIMIEGITPEGVRAGASVESWCNTWIEQRRRHVRPKTYQAEHSLLRRWIIPTLGRRKLDTLGPTDMRELVTTMEKGGSSTTNARYAQRILQQALKAAIVEGHSVPQRALLAEKPGAAVSDRKAIPLDDAVTLLSAARKRPDAARWVAALLQGMRQGEVLGLTWECIDLKAGTLDISWQLQELRYEDRARGTFLKPDGYDCRQISGSYHLVRPKTEHGKRIIPLVPWMVSQLKALHEAGDLSPTGLVWTRDGDPLMPRSAAEDRKAWKALQDAAKVWKATSADGKHTYYVLHEARHTTATLLLAAGVDPEVIKAIMGHSSIVTTQGYQHVNSAMAKKALEAVAKELKLEK